jgi:hypothetical protein
MKTTPKNNPNRIRTSEKLKTADHQQHHPKIVVAGDIKTLKLQISADL